MKQTFAVRLAQFIASANAGQQSKVRLTSGEEIDVISEADSVSGMWCYLYSCPDGDYVVAQECR